MKRREDAKIKKMRDEKKKVKVQENSFSFIYFTASDPL